MRAHRRRSRRQAQPNYGSTSGSNPSLFLETGYNFTTPLGYAYFPRGDELLCPPRFRGRENAPTIQISSGFIRGIPA
jgi:hypothetical protein